MSPDSDGRLRGARTTLVVTALCLVVLGVLGLGAERHLSPTSLSIPGTTSTHGEALARRYFGDSVPFAVVLRGPKTEIDRQGPQLVRALERMRDSTVVSPWDGSSLRALRPGARRALILVDFHESLDAVIRSTVPRIKSVLDAHVKPPLRVAHAGYATISRELQDEALAASERAELLAAPLLILILLVVFRSVIAALLPLLFGMAAVLMCRGVLVILTSFMQIDALSLVVCTMMGLALGVDYSLLIVSRFREELAPGVEPRWAALRTRHSAGRTTVVAGSTLFLSILVSAFVAPGALLVSLSTALAVSAAISIAIAWWVLPALLALLGERVNAFPIGRRGATRVGSRAASLASAALRRPARSVALILTPLLLLAAPALALNTGAPGVGELSTSNPARQDVETIGRVAGPGWEAPFSLILASARGPITTKRQLTSLARWQRRIGRQPGVSTVIGPAPINRASHLIQHLKSGFTPGRGAVPARLAGLGSRLDRASHGVGRLRTGLAEASAGSGLLGIGSQRARIGATRVASSLERASARGRLAEQKLRQLRQGSARLDAGQRQVEANGLALSAGLSTVLAALGDGGLRRAQRLAAELGKSAQAQPEFLRQAEEAVILARLLAIGREELQQLRLLATDLNGGLRRIGDGGRQLRSGISRLADASAGVDSGLRRLSGGAGRLATGLDGLQSGATVLHEGIAGAFHRTYPLQIGLNRAGRRAAFSAHQFTRQRATLARHSPGIFDSGYFVLSALDGARPSRRSLIQEAINVSRGGQAVRLMVVPDASLNSARSMAVQGLLRADGQALSRSLGLRYGLTGGAAVLNDYGAVTKSRLPLVLGSIVLVTFLMLVAILRAPLLAGLTIALNLVSIGAALGIISLLCHVPAGYPLGGHPYIDTIGGAAIFGVTFGLSIDYAVFLIARMRERHEQGAANATAIAFGLERTAGLITGAAAIMAAVFAAFAAAPVATVSQMGVGLFVAILLDATVVRIVLLPALMLLLGERIWHVPNWLERLLPGAGVEGAVERAAA